MKTSLIAVFGLAALAGRSLAQPVFISPPVRLPEPSPQQNQTSGNSQNPSAEASASTGESTAEAPFRWRNIVFRPHVAYQFLYGTGVLSQTNQAQKTIVQTITPGIAMDLGSHWILDYSPSIVLYSDSSFDNTLNHSLSLTGQTTYEDWRFGTSFDLDISNSPQTETGTQTDQQNYSGSVTASRQLNANLSVDLSAGADIRIAEGFNSSRNYHTLNWLNRQYGPNLGLGLGAGVGFEDVDTGSDMTYERVLGRIVWHITGKLDLSLNGGPEFRQFVDSDEPMLINPTFGGALKYQVFDPTTLTLRADRTVASSFFENQVVETTSVRAELSQRLFARYYLGLAGGYTFTSYESSVQGTSSNRSDETPFVTASLGTSFLKRGNASIFYSWAENSSNEDGFSYASDQMGFNISYAY
jgi:hypothetical protein